MKRFLAVILAMTMCMTMISACGKISKSAPTTEGTEVTNQATEYTPVGVEALNGKKIMFIGNSFTYYGKCVLQKSMTDYSQDQRTNDQGYFYQICKANGVDVSVCNFTFGGHQLKDFYSHSCAADRGHDGVDHLAYLNDLNYDYVVLQNGTASKKYTDILAECQPLMDFFLEANPNVKFVFLVHQRVHEIEYAWRSSIKDLEDAGVIVVDWGALVNDVINGDTSVPGATQEYNKNSFIISQSESDGYHPNMLTGYITALATFCAITGESAVGQPYSFGDDNSLTGISAIASYRVKYYTYDPGTNFDAILASEADMTGIQQLIDQYLETKAYRNY